MTPEAEKIPLRVQGTVYASGLFANSMNNMMNVVVPLWIVTIEPSPLMIGIAIGSRSFMPLCLSIHGGAMMDRVGTRRVVVFFAVIAMVTAPLYPLMPWLIAVIILQMLNGLSTTMGWVGAQTLVGQVMRGSATHAGRLSSIIRIGNVGGPPLIGFIWDWLGPWGAFTLLALPGIAMLASAMALPEPMDGQSDGRQDKHPAPGRGRLRLRHLIPNPRDYIDAFRLLLIPTIAFVVMVAVVRISGHGIRTSFYVIYLGEIGFSATLIGILMSVHGLIGIGGALLAGPIARMGHMPLLLVITVVLSIIFIAITPLLGTFTLLFVVSALRGGTMGLSQPLMISIMSQSAGRTAQGRAVGLRTTTNRLASVLIPIAMGAVIEVTGIENGFLIIGGILLALCLLLIPAALRAEKPDG